MKIAQSVADMFPISPVGILSHSSELFYINWQLDIEVLAKMTVSNMNMSSPSHIAAFLSLTLCVWILYGEQWQKNKLIFQ